MRCHRELTIFSSYWSATKTSELWLELRTGANYCFADAERNAKAERQHARTRYNTQDSSHATYVDGNNIYGWVKVPALPYKNIQFEPSRPTLGTSLETPGDAEMGYVAEGSLKFQPEAHDTAVDFRR